MDLIVSIYGCMFLIGFLANGLLGLKFFCGPSGKTTNPFLYELLFSDLLVCCLSGPSSVLILYTVTHISPTWLQIFLFLQGWPISASNLSMMALSISRYLTMKNFKTTENDLKRKILLVSCIVFIWILAALLTCIHLLNHGRKKIFLYLLDLFAGHLVPISVVLLCYMVLNFKLTTLSLSARASCGEMPLPIPMFRQRGNLIIISGLPQKKTKRIKPVDLIKVEEDILQMRRTTLCNRTRLANSLLFMAIAFTLCWLPYIICHLCEQLDVYLINEQYTLLLGQFHSALNPILYWSYNRKWPKLTFKCVFPHFSEERSASSTNEANLGPFNPKYIRPYHRRQSLNDMMPCDYQSMEVLYGPSSSTPKARPHYYSTRMRPTRNERPKFVKSKSSELFY